MRFGIQLYPPRTAPEMARYAAKALARYPFERIWVPDHLTYENVFVILAAILSRTEACAGTSVVQPFSRTPVDLASSFAALAHLAGDRGITVGIGAGSASSDMIRKRNRVDMTRETILLMRSLFAGETRTLGEFPVLTEFFRLEPGAPAFLRLPPVKMPEILVAAAGPRMLQLAGEVGDGVIVSNLSFPTALVRRGALDAAMASLAAARSRPDPQSKFTKVLHLHVSVARDGAAAKQCARRMGAAALIQGHLLRRRMLDLPLPDELAGAVREAQGRGQSLEALTSLVSDQLLSEVGTVIAGTAAECIAGIDEMLRAAKSYRFHIVDLASPLGPDWDEAIDLIGEEIIPELERRSSRYGIG